MFLISQNAVRSGLTYRVAAELVGSGFAQCRSGDMESPLRHVFVPRMTGPVVGFMPALNSKYIATKVAAVSFDNPNKGLDSHQGVVLLFDRPTGQVLAVVDGTELTAVRTTAVSLFSLNLLTRLGRTFSSTNRVAVVGAGVQAFHHIRMFHLEFSTKYFIIQSRDSARVSQLRDALNDLDIVIEHRSYGASLKDCAVIVTATHANEVILTGSQVCDEVVIFALGACRGDAQEVATDILTDCTFVLDRHESFSGSGEGVYRSSIGGALDLSELANETCRLQSGRPIVVKAVGHGFEDLVCAAYLFEHAAQTPFVAEIASFGGQRAY